MGQNNLRKASLFYLVGNLFNKGISFLTVPIFTRILSTSDYGIVNTYYSWVSILSMLIGFSVYMGIRAAFVDYEERIDDFMAVTTTFTVACGAIFVAIFGTSLLLITNINILIIVLCFLEGLALALIQNYSVYLMMKFRYRFRTILMIVPNLLGAVFSIITILFITRSIPYMGRIVSTATVDISFAILVIVIVYKKSHLLYDKKMLKYALSISMPLVLHGLALNVLSQSDRTMITWLADSSQTGIYSLIYNFSVIATVITTAFDGVWIPWFTQKLKDRKVDLINEKVQYYVTFMTAAVIGVILLGPEVVKILATEQYWDGISIIPPIVISNFIVFAYSLYVNVEHFHKHAICITKCTIVAALLNLLLNFFLIPKYGYVAAAYTTLISYFVALILHAKESKKLEGKLYPIRIFYSAILHLTIAVIVFYLFIDAPYIRIGILGIYLILVSLNNIEFIKGLIPFFINKK